MAASAAARLRASLAGRLVVFRKSSGMVTAVICVLSAPCASASEDEDDVDDAGGLSSSQRFSLLQSFYPTQELYGGADASVHAWSIYTGTTVAPFGTIRANGLRLRSAAGYGAYRYSSPRWDGARRYRVPFQGQQATADVLIGWQQAFGPWILKGFAGSTLENHAITPIDEENRVQGGRLGVKVALETWLSLGDWAFVQTDLAWSTPFAAHTARVRAGYRLHPIWSVGLEGAVVGNANYQSARTGVFVRVESNIGEVSISGGLSSDLDANINPYGAISLLWRF